MPIFRIHICQDSVIDPEGGSYSVGELTFGNFHETFQMCTDYWSADRYTEQWSNAIERLRKGHSPSAITASYDGPDANFHKIFPLFIERDRVIMQEQIIFTDSLEIPFDPANPWVVVVPRELDDVDEPYKPSEWSILISNLPAA